MLCVVCRGGGAGLGGRQSECYALTSIARPPGRGAFIASRRWVACSGLRRAGPVGRWAAPPSGCGLGAQAQAGRRGPCRRNPVARAPGYGRLWSSAVSLVSKVRNKQAKEISLGYDYGIRRAGGRGGRGRRTRRAAPPSCLRAALVARWPTAAAAWWSPPPIKVQTCRRARCGAAGGRMLTLHQPWSCACVAALCLLGRGLKAFAAGRRLAPAQAVSGGGIQKPTAEDKKSRDKRRGRDVEEDEEELIAEDEADIEVTRARRQAAVGVSALVTLSEAMCALSSAGVGRRVGRC